MQPDLLGCICLYDDYKCARNCRTNDHEPYAPPSGARLVEIKCEPSNNEPGNIACERVEDEENKRPDQEIVGVEAWSNGLLRIWFTPPPTAARGKKTLVA
jgi:hypothetical protein